MRRIEVLVRSPDLKTEAKSYPVVWMNYQKWARLNPQLAKPKFDHDEIMILKLKDPVAVKDVKIAKLSAKNSEEIYKYGIQPELAGWSTIASKDVARKVDLLSEPSCKISVKSFYETELCARSVTGLTKSDIGGPLFYKDKKILGILVSLCESKECYSLFASIGPYRNFIEKYTSN